MCKATLVEIVLVQHIAQQHHVLLQAHFRSTLSCRQVVYRTQSFLRRRNCHDRRRCLAYQLHEHLLVNRTILNTSSSHKELTKKEGHKELKELFVSK